MFLKQSKLSFSFVSVLPKTNCFEMLNRAYIFTSGALPPRKKIMMKELRDQSLFEVPRPHTDKNLPS